MTKNPIPSKTRKIMLRLAKKVAGSYGYSKEDEKDLMQIFTFALIVNLPKHDPSLSSLETFFYQVINSQFVDILRNSQCQKRDWRKSFVSLEDKVLVDGEAVSLHSFIEEKDLVCNKHTKKMPAEIAQDLRLDLSEAIKTLPKDFQKVIELLKTHSISEIVLELGMPRTSFYDEYLIPLRKFFKEKGLEKYL